MSKIREDYIPERPAGEDWKEGDKPYSRSLRPGEVLKERTYKGYTMLALNPHSFVTIVGLEDLGLFTAFHLAEAAIDKYLDKGTCAPAQ